MGSLQFQNRLDILVGCMFSGKTSALIRELSLFGELGLSVLYINHALDNRASTAYSTHSPLVKDTKLNIDTRQTHDLREMDTGSISNYDIIGIDEAQFFDSYLIEFVRKLVDDYGKYVIVVGLDGTFDRNKFGYILDLIPLATNVKKLHAYCGRCAKNNKTLELATFTHCLCREGVTDESLNIGGSDKYVALCRSCYLHLNRTHT